MSSCLVVIQAALADFVRLDLRAELDSLLLGFFLDFIATFTLQRRLGGLLAFRAGRFRQRKAKIAHLGV